MTPSALTNPKPVESPLVSVVIPAYNAAKYLAQTLESVRAQTFPDWECIVVDDGSSDDTARICGEFAAQDGRIRLIQQSNAGVSVARNTGFSQSNVHAPFVAFLDADDLWEPEMLRSLVDALEAHPPASAAHCNAFYIDAEGNRTNQGVLEECGRARYVSQSAKGGKRPSIGRSLANEPTTFAQAVVSCPIMTPGCVVMRRTAWARVGGFDPSFSTLADWEMWVRLARLSDLPFVDQPLLAYRQHDSNMSSGRKKAMAEGRKLRHLIIHSNTNTPAQKRLALQAYRAFYWYLACQRYPGAWNSVRRGQLKPAAQDLILALVNTAMALKGRP